MMELFNDYGTFTYKILQTKTSFQNKTKHKFGHTICKTLMQGNYVPYISLIGLHAETNLDTSQKYGGLDKDVAKKTIIFSLEGLW